MENKKPRITIPDSLRGNELGTFTHESVAVRLPDIARRMLGENHFSPVVIGRIETLIREIADGRIRFLSDPGAPDEEAWRGYVAPYLGQKWLDVPWFFAETYFYRRIMEATGYFQPGEGRAADPFAYQKRQGLSTSQEAIRRLGRRLTGWLEDGRRQPDVLGYLLAADLWGNQADLSLWPADGKEKPDHQEVDQQEAHTLADDTGAVVEHLFDQPSQVDFIVDNAGFELVVDLYLAAYLLHHGLADNVQLHLKAHPTFVSDATAADIGQTVAHLADDDDPDVREIGRRLTAWLQNGRLGLQQDWFWTSPLEMWKMPASLRQELARSRLLISKGDAHYRRLLGDRHWPFTTPFAGIVNYLPAPLVALRTLKSEVVVGLEPGQPEAIQALDANWLVDGRWGVIQFYAG